VVSVPVGSNWSTGALGSTGTVVVVDVSVAAPSMGSQVPKPPTSVMKLSMSSTVPVLRAPAHRTAEATQMIPKSTAKNSTEILSTDHGSMWRTMRRTLRARTLPRRFSAARPSAAACFVSPASLA
jgi:hypothetical protein